MAFDKNNPCTKDCPDRPNCKGCVRGNEYRNKKIAEHKRKIPESDFRNYEMDRYNTAMKKADKFKRGKIR